MGYFPETIMPKVIRPETGREVDGDPSICNARDRNIHHREIIAIEKFLVGLGWGSSGNDGGLASMMPAILSMLRMPMYQVAGQITITQATGYETIPLSQYPRMVRTVTDGTHLAPGDVVIHADPATGTAGFPDSGWLTKFNTISASTVAGPPQYKNYGFGKTISSQETIQYSGKTDTAFLSCVRDASTAQNLPAGQTAVIVCGKASLGLSLVSFNNVDGDDVRQLYAEHDSNLKVSAALYQAANTLTPLGDISVLYDITVVGPFGVLDLSALIGANY